MAIDMRLRPPFPAWIENGAFDAHLRFTRSVRGFDVAPSAEEKSVDLLLREMDEAGITVGVVMGGRSRNRTRDISNQSLASSLQQYKGRFVGFIGTDPDDIAGTLSDIEDFSKLDVFRGVCVEPGAATIPRWSDDPSLDPIYEACVKAGLPVSITLSAAVSLFSGHDISWSRPGSIHRVATKYPDLPIIVSHAAWPWAEEMIAVALVCPNVYVSPDVYISTYGMPAIAPYIDAANLFLEDRTLFGTAYPIQSLTTGIRDFGRQAWRKEIVPKILHENAAKLLKLD